MVCEFGIGLGDVAGSQPWPRTRIRSWALSVVQQPTSLAMASRHLLNPLAPLNQPTPSELDGVPLILERDLRACELLWPGLSVQLEWTYAHA